MSLFDSLLYSFSNIFSIGPDLYDDEGDECCGGSGPGGTCCKNLSPSLQQQKDRVIMTTPPLTLPACQQQQQQQKQQQQDLYTCRCSDGDHATSTASDDDLRTKISLVVCGQPLQRQISPPSTALSPSSNNLAWVEYYLQKSTEFKTCTVALDRQRQDLLFSLSQCVFVLSGTSKDNRPLNRLLDWMNEQIMMTPRHPPLHHLAYGIIYLGNHELASLFQEKLEQLGATEIQPIYDVQHLQQSDDDEEKLQQWTEALLDGLRQRSTKQHHHHDHHQHPTTTSAGCTNGMIDVEDMGQVAQKINLMNKKKLVKQHPRARPKRIIGLDPTTSRQKALPTTQVTTSSIGI